MRPPAEVPAPASFVDGVALVTGGSQGLGFAVAEALKARGARGLVLVGRDPDKGRRAAEALTGEGCRAEFVAADVGTAEGCEAAVAAVDAAFGAPHAVVNCAAFTDRGTAWDASAELWEKMLLVNVRGPALVAQGAAALMRRDGVRGSIVMIGSVAGHGGAPELLPYAASKSALVALTRNLAYQLMWWGIRVNLVCPGWMNTPAEDVVQRRFHGAGDGWLEEAAASRPFGRLIEPVEIARTIAHVATDESGMMTGACIDYDQSVLGAGDAPVPPRPPDLPGAP
ncbi:MAG: SDR family oxidoreductase [Actinomyces sp.]|nr:MAG: SDR family oxidoreductase [Actinomyces sp.]